MTHPQGTYLSTHSKARTETNIPLEKVHCTIPYIHLVPTKRNLKLVFSSLNPSPTNYPLHNNIIHCLIMKILKISIILFWLNPLNDPLIPQYSIIFETTSSLKAYFPRLITSITNKIIRWGGMPVHKVVILVTYHGCVADASEITIPGKLKNNK